MRKLIGFFSALMFLMFSATTAIANTQTQSNSTMTNSKRYISDSAITAKIKTSLLADKDINSLSISVKTNKGIVTLSGKVTNKLQKQKAIQIARTTSGVKLVKDKLIIKK